MPRPRTALARSAVLVGALLVAACGSTPVVTPSAPVDEPSATVASGTAPSQAASGDDAFASMLADAIARNGQPIADAGIDVEREQLLADMGVPTALGLDADQILAVVGDAEAAARKQLVIPQGFGREGAATARLAAFRSLPAPYAEFQAYLVGGIANIGVAGPSTYHGDEGSVKGTQAEGGMTATSEMHPVVDVVFTGSDVKIDLNTDITNTVTDDATGTTVLTETRHATMTGELDGCPSAAGLVPGSLVVSSTEETSTFAGPRARVGSHSTGSQKRSSTFQGTSDDSATLGSVTQAFTQDDQYKRTASADGGPEATQEGSASFTASGINDGVPAGGPFAPTTGDWSGATTSSKTSGTVTPAMTSQTSGNAASDYAIIKAAYAEAQKVWRDTRCVIVTAPGYIPESSFANNNKPTHTEEVDKGSTTAFQVGLGHRFSQKVAAKITATLDGKESLDPDHLDTAPGQLTYKAPNEDGKDGIVQLESVSRQGIGKLKLTFHTGGKKLKVSINGTMTTSGFGVSYTTTVHAKDILLSPMATSPQITPDGLTEMVTYSGGGPATAEVRIKIADCPKPYTQKGTLKLFADHEVNVVTNLDLRWFVYWDPDSTFRTTGGSCAGLPLDSFTGTSAAGPVGGFMTVLGSVEFGPKGGNGHWKLTKVLGQSSNKIDVEVSAEIVSETK